MRLIYILAVLLFSLLLYPQQPSKPSATELFQKIKSASVLANVLYVAAHPDDENTRLVSYFANDAMCRTAYLSLTRGDGGQNLIGPELRELLGVIRTQELIEARKIDKGEQFFSRAYDFGYSKTPEETLKIWDRDAVLADVVRIIRQFRPDVIINRFDHRTPGTTHGHHTASAILSLEAFNLAAQVSALDDQLQGLQPWQTSRIFFNTSFWFYGGREKFENADKSHLFRVQTGLYNPLTGKSNQEIAALSRSRHSSQGFGTLGARGDELEYLELLKGTSPSEATDIFEGINTKWSRVDGGEKIGRMLAKIEAEYVFTDPAASIPALVDVYLAIGQIKDEFWKQIKQKEIADLITGCAGLYIEVSTSVPEATKGTAIPVMVELINRSQASMTLKSVVVGKNEPQEKNVRLENNKPYFIKINSVITNDLPFTQPYWLENPTEKGMFSVSENQIGLAEAKRELKAQIELEVGGALFLIEQPVVFKHNDDIHGEIFEPFDVVPEATSTFTEKVTLFSSGKAKIIEVRVTAQKDDVSGAATLELPQGWKASPKFIDFNLHSKGQETTVKFSVTPPTEPSSATMISVLEVGNKRLDREMTKIKYPHINKQVVLRPSSAKLVRLELKTEQKKIAYILGAGDQVHRSLQQMGYDVTLLQPSKITKERLHHFDVVILGIRAYNTVSELAVKQNILLDFVKEGKTMIVQYNTLDDLVTQQFSPYPLKISRDRVTEEDATVLFLNPAHRVVNAPNKITFRDFSGWIQEQGLYYPSQWDKAFTPIFQAADQGETPKSGALLVAKYGKGHYIYTGLSFFRQLPEGVPGAFRILSNLISIK
jgi:LmbE family N-acetylglucosaminyl deacetylase